MRIVIAGGGTAGHVYPAIALARRLQENFDADVSFVGTGRGLEADLVPAAGFRLLQIDARPFRRSLSPGSLIAPVVLLRSVRQSHPLVAVSDAVVGMGGYASGPPVVAAVRAGRPLVLHEQNAVPGLANRLFARRAKVVALSFEEAARRMPHRTRTVVTGNPVREEIAMLRDRREVLRDEAFAELKLDAARTTVVIFGGSQGALHVNRVAIGSFRTLRDRRDLQFLLISGRSHADSMARDIEPYGSGEALLVRSLPFLERMELAYAAADLVVSRGGATSIAEISAAGLPALLIPYPYATANHQEANARALERAGGASVMLDDDMTPATLARMVTSLTGDRETLGAMGEASAKWGKPGAADALAELVATAAEGSE